MKTAADYPYDRRYGDDPDRARLRGLDRLRAIENRSHARLLFALFDHCQANERNPAFKTRLEREESRKREEDQAHLESMADKAQRGVYGPLAAKIAKDFLAQYGNTEGALVELRRLLSEMPENSRVSG